MFSICKLVVALGCATLTALPLPVLAEWVPVADSSDGTQIQVDFDSIVRQGNLVSFWRRSVKALPDPNGVSVIGFYSSIDCSTAKLILRRSVLTDKSGNVLFNQKMYQVEYIKPNSGNAHLYNSVCQ